ncbi:MAG: hypothetical protein FJ207_04780 [Gemmatimonadetes bacterium]|nr:hypothetical protein [Gemmatimonadota bacterium]
MLTEEQRASVEQMRTRAERVRNGRQGFGPGGRVGRGSARGFGPGGGIRRGGRGGFGPGGFAPGSRGFRGDGPVGGPRRFGPR